MIMSNVRTVFKLLDVVAGFFSLCFCLYGLYDLFKGGTYDNVTIAFLVAMLFLTVRYFSKFNVIKTVKESVGEA